jgi:hypothetical protein
MFMNRVFANMNSLIIANGTIIVSLALVLFILITQNTGCANGA